MENIIKDKITQKEETGEFNPRKMLNRIYQRLFIMGWYEGAVPMRTQAKACDYQNDMVGATFMLRQGRE